MTTAWTLNICLGNSIQFIPVVLLFCHFVIILSFDMDYSSAFASTFDLPPASEQSALSPCLQPVNFPLS